MAATIPLFVYEQEKKRVFKRRKLLEHLSEAEIQKHCGMPWWGVRQVLTLFEDLEGKKAFSIPLETRVLSFISFLRSGTFQWTIGSLSGISQSSASRFIAAAKDILVSKVNDFIKFPESNQEFIDIINGFHDLANFPGVIGAIDGTQIPIRAPKEKEYAYVNRKGFHSINVQVVVDHKSRFRDVVVRWPGATHDAFIWNASGLKERLARLTAPGHLIGNLQYL